MKIRYVIVTLLLFLFITPKVNASMCSKSDMLRVKGDANTVKITYEHVLANEQGDVSGLFNLLITGLTEDLVLVEEATGRTYSSNSNVDGVITIKNIQGNNFVFKLFYPNCDNKLMRTIKFSLPKFNFYSLHESCKNITEDDLEICNMWYQGELDDNIFNKKMEEYLKLKEEKTKQAKKENTFFKQIINFLVNYYLYIISTIVLIVIITVVIIIKRKRSILE